MGTEAIKVLITGVPKHLYYLRGDTKVSVGDSVTVFLGKRIVHGWALEVLDISSAISNIKEGFSANSNTALSVQGNCAVQLAFIDEKEVSQEPQLKKILSSSPCFHAEQLELFKWIAEYYGVSLCSVLDCAIPQKSEAKKILYVEASSLLNQQLKEQPHLLDELDKKAKTQAAVLKSVLSSEKAVSIASLESSFLSARTVISALEKKGLLKTKKMESSSLESLYCSSENNINSPEFFIYKLNNEQSIAVEKVKRTIDKKEFKPYLLYGVTGSGKTEVYIRLVEHALSTGGSALVIVPEIALTPQLFDRFYARLKAPLALLHCQVGNTPRWEAWQSLLDGTAKVAIGARSAVFAPLKNLSLIIVDEEHESSYKQSDGLRYHARDIAVMRGKFSRSAVVLGSATPSFESMVNVIKTRYKLIELPNRATVKPLPRIEIVDMNKIKRKEMLSDNVSPQLYKALCETLEASLQAMILYNRRGFASYLQCSSCLESVMCPNCSVTLTLHKKRNRLICHYCNLQMTPPKYCKLCRNPKTTRMETDETGHLITKASVIDKYGLLVEHGSGTEKVVDELTFLFPQANIVRMDSDTVRKKGAYREILGNMKAKRTDILIGTQMIAKGHDIPGVTLVGIIDADVGLSIPDFRASEKSYQLITQAAGRAGRGEEAGLVIIQTRRPTHPTITAAATGRYKAFARYELEYRKSLSYPPHARLMRIIVSSENRQDAYNLSLQTKEAVETFIRQSEELNSTKILGPGTAPIERLVNRFRFHLLVKSQSAKLLSALAAYINTWKTTIEEPKDLRIIADVDAVDMM